MAHELRIFLMLQLQHNYRGVRGLLPAHIVVLQYLLTSRCLFYSPTLLTMNFNIKIVSLHKDL